MRLTFVVVLTIMVLSCGNKDKVPGDVIPRDKMEKLMWDMLLADRFNSQFIVKDSARYDVKLESLKVYEQVFQVNQTNRDQFIKSYKFYMSRPDISKAMFDSLSAKSNRNRDSLFKKME